MSTEILFNKTGGRLTDKSIMKYKSMQPEFEVAGAETISKRESYPKGAQVSVSKEKEVSLTRSLNRKIDYRIQQENNEVIIQVRDGETGEVIRQIPQEEFVRLVDNISEFNKNVLKETA